MSPFIINFVHCHVRIVCKEITIVTRCLRKIKKKEHSCSIILINMTLVFSLLIMGEHPRKDEESEEQYKKIIFMSKYKIDRSVYV